MSDRAALLAATVRPPRRGKVWALTLDTTDRAYDLSALDLPQDFKSGANDDVFITMQAEDADAYYYFHSATASDLDETTADAAGAPQVTQNNAHCARLPADASIDLLINRVADRWLIVKGSAAGILRLWPSSQNTAR